MEIYLVRHTTPAIDKGICYGQTNLDVTDSFETEYKAVHKKISFAEGMQVFSSPLKRCKKLANTFDEAVVEDARLMELNFGEWEMKAWDHIPSEEITPWMNDFVTLPAPNGESYVTLQKRMVSFLNERILPAQKSLIIVSHAGPIRALLAYIKKIPLKDSFAIQLNYGHVVHLSYKDATFNIEKGLQIK